MPVHCSRCGEEFLGAVNRCWRCGAPMVSLPGAEQQPPVRRSPIADAQLVAGAQPTSSSPNTSEAPPEEPLSTTVKNTALTSAHRAAVEILDSTAERPLPPTESPGEVESSVWAEVPEENDSASPRTSPFSTKVSAPEGSNPDASSPHETAELSSTATDHSDTHPPRRNSPFSSVGNEPVRGNRGFVFSHTAPPAQPPNYPRHVAAVGGAVASVVLGLLALVSAFVIDAGGLGIIGPLIVAVLGLGMGIWGIYSDRRGVATLGIILCCLALSVSGVRGVIAVYKHWNDGLGPWETINEPGSNL